MKSVVEQVLAYGISQPNKLALTDGKRNKTYSELAAGIFCASEVLSKRFGLKKGDSIVIAADKQPEFVSLYLACHLLGVITLPIAPDTNEKRYRLIKDKLHPSLVVGFQDDDPAMKTALLSEFVGSAEIQDFFIPLDRVADIMFTTGTTGVPKGVLLTQKNIAAAARNINTFIQNTANDVEMIALPISHSFGIGRMRCALSNGQTVVMLGSFANAKRFFRFIDEYGVTGFGMVPASWALLKRLSGMKLAEFKDQLHYIEIGSAPMPIDEKTTLIDALPNTRICMHYGLTEASRSAFMEFHECRDRLTTIGKQSPNMNITIRDETGKEVPFGAEGEICVAGDAVMKGYLNLPNEEFFWGDDFRTGDWGYIDEDGFISLTGRKKELINVGGKKVSPIEVEEILMELDFVKDCACISIPDPEGILGEVIKAFIVSDEPEKISKEIIDPLIGSKLEGYKHPTEYTKVDEIPKTTSGKVQRLLLKRIEDKASAV